MQSRKPVLNSYTAMVPWVQSLGQLPPGLWLAPLAPDAWSMAESIAHLLARDGYTRPRTWPTSELSWSIVAKLSHQLQGHDDRQGDPDVSERNTAVRAMIKELQDAFSETLNTLYDLPEEYLQQPCGHACARGGSAQDLLVHNIFHEKQHAGQVWNIRDELRLLQGWGNARLFPLLVDYYLSRAQLIGSLFGLTDEQLDQTPLAGGWTVRQTIEHALGSERRSISALRDEYEYSTSAHRGIGHDQNVSKVGTAG